jgi:hypothetical protein
MIYLVQLDNAYKIGYAKDINKRIKNLSATHVVVNLIDSKEGEISDERVIHKLCVSFKIKNELFEINDEVVQIFKNYVVPIKEPKYDNNNNVLFKFNSYDEILENHDKRLTILEEQLIEFNKQIGEIIKVK